MEQFRLKKSDRAHWGGVFANLSYVDFVGLVLGLKLVSGDGSTQTALGLEPNATESICASLYMQASFDGQPWDQLCIKGTHGDAIRILSPDSYMKINSSAFTNYYSGYVDQAWSRYQNKSVLTIDTQSSAGNVTCTTSGEQMSCKDDNRVYNKPSTGDIFGCSTGPFALHDNDNGVHQAVVPRLCAAFVRSTLLLEGSDLQPRQNESPLPFPGTISSKIGPATTPRRVFADSMITSFDSCGILKVEEASLLHMGIDHTIFIFFLSFFFVAA
jgi:hypothetical protein